MKILYSDIKKLVPGLKASPLQVGEFLTMAGFMMDGFEKVKYQGKKDFSISLEVRHNRADCLSVIGFANEIAAKWNLKTKLPKIGKLPKKHASQNIKVVDGKYIKRVLAFEIEGICNKKSPQWLINWLALYDMNSKNLLVDLSNYVMLLTGHPSHLLDLAKMHGKLHWDMNKKYKTITTLDGTSVNLTEDREIILRDDKNILAIAGIVGGKKAELDLKTTSIIAEMAVYDPGTVRKNSVGTKVNTEASTRLSRWLDPNGLDYAMDLLLTLILQYCGGNEITLRKFSYYPKKYSAPKIKFDPDKPSIYAGIKIPKEKAVEILKDLRFGVKKSGKNYIAVPPTDRLDVSIEEDLIEEVTRIYGFEKIPASVVPKLDVTKDITPIVVNLAERVRDILSILGYDEILSSPLTTKKSNKLTNYRDWKLVTTQNAVNEEFPDLRQSIGAGLLNQLAEHRKKNLAYIQIFEVGKIFGRVGKKYEEHESLGILFNNIQSSANLEYLRYILEITLRYLGLDDISYRESVKNPPMANAYSCHDVIIKEKPVGIIYKLKPQVKNERSYFAEINLSLLSDIVGTFKGKPAVELTKKLVTLDANLELSKTDSIYKLIESFKKKVGRKNLWSIEVKDAFPVENKVKYTIRVSYKELGDPEAKKLHLKVFGLNK
ncbi:MAG: phenylalanine--tRNA ligase subunit beta [Candidatus Moraniibacteriota bacterium]